MPCFDKKLEASRDYFFNEEQQTRDVDCVLTSGEILAMIKERDVDFLALDEGPLDQLYVLPMRLLVFTLALSDSQM